MLPAFEEVVQPGLIEGLHLGDGLAGQQGLVHLAVAQQAAKGLGVPGVRVELVQCAADFQAGADRLEGVAVGEDDGDAAAVLPGELAGIGGKANRDEADARQFGLVQLGNQLVAVQPWGPEDFKGVAVPRPTDMFVGSSRQIPG